MTPLTNSAFDHGRIWRFAFPMILSNLSTPLLGLVDTAVMGHLDSASFLGAVAFGGIVFTFVFWGFGFLRMGTTGIVAQAYGNDDFDEVRAVLGRSLLLAAIISALVLLLQHPIRRVGLALVESGGRLEQLADLYIAIRIWSTPATLGNYVLIGLFLGLQKPAKTLLLVASANACNIILDLVLVVLLKMEVAGIALATVVSEYTGFIVGLNLLKRELAGHSGGWQWVKILNPAEIRRIMAINGDIFIRTLCLIFVFAFFNVQSAGLGELMLAANTVLLQFQMFMAYALDGFAHAAESLIGQAVGGRDRTRFRQSVNTAALWSVSLAAVFTSAYALFGSRIIDLLTDLEPVRSTAYTYLPWVAAAPLVSVWCYLLDGIFIGATLSRAMRNTMLASTVFCYLPAWYFTRDLLNHGLWLSLLLFMAARGLSMGWVYRKTTLFH